MNPMTKDLKHESSDEFGQAMEHFARGVRRSNLADAQTWLAVAERCLCLHRQLVDFIAADDKLEAARIEHPYRLTILDYRARFS